MNQQNFYKIKKEFFDLREGMLLLNRAINAKDIFWIRRLVRKHFEQLKRIYQLCDNEKGSR